MRPKVVLFVPQFPQISEPFIVTKFLGMLSSGIDTHIICYKKNHTQLVNNDLLKNSNNVLARVHDTLYTSSKLKVLLRGPFKIMSCFIKAPDQVLPYLFTLLKSKKKSYLKTFFEGCFHQKVVCI